MWLCSQPATTTAKTTASSLSSSNITTITSSLKTAAIKSRWFPVFSFVCIEWRATSNDARQRRLPNICHFYFSFISASSFFKCWPITASFCLFSSLWHHQLKYKWKKRIWCAWDSNPGCTDGTAELWRSLHFCSIYWGKGSRDSKPRLAKLEDRQWPLIRLK